MMGLLITLTLLLVGWFFGRLAERRHERSLFLREHGLRRQTVMTLKRAPADWNINAATLVTGNVVISLDYYKRFVAGLRSLVGGNIPGFESLLQRARREAMLRMREDARRQGLNAVINVRLETVTLATNGRGVAGVEVLAFGTALRRVDEQQATHLSGGFSLPAQTRSPPSDPYCLSG